MSTPKTVTTRGELSCWTATKTTRGAFVRANYFDVPLTGDRLADDTAAARVMLELVRLVKGSTDHERRCHRWTVAQMLREVAEDTATAKAFRYLLAEVVLAGIVHADSEPWALTEIQMAEDRSNSYAKAEADERASFIERMKAGRAAKRQREAVQVLCRWPAPSATADALGTREAA